MSLNLGNSNWFFKVKFELRKLSIKGYSIIDIYDIFYTFIKITDNVSEVTRYKIIRLLCEYITATDSIGEIGTEMLLFSYELCTV